MNRLTFATLAVVLLAAPAFSQKLPVTVRSPDGRIALKIERNDAGHLTYAINAMARQSSPVPSCA